jgi:hypothetical protein
MNVPLPRVQDGTVLAGSRPRPPGGLRPALTPAPADADRQRPGAEEGLFLE